VAEFKGEYFQPSNRINERRVRKMARLLTAGQKAAEKGEDAEAGQFLMQLKEMEDDLVNMCLRPEDIERFDALCDEHGSTEDELRAFMAASIAEHAERPTSRPSVSSDGPISTPPSSEVDSYSQAIAQREQEGRPDLALVLLQTQEQRSA
jgi:hypothetical protein